MEEKAEIKTIRGMYEFKVFWLRLFFKYPSYAKELFEVWLMVDLWSMDSLLLEVEEFVSSLLVGGTGANVPRQDELIERWEVIAEKSLNLQEDILNSQ